MRETPPPADGRELVRDLLSRKPVRLRWDLTCEQVDAVAETMIERSKSKLDAVAAAHASGAALTWQSCMEPLVQDDVEARVLDSVVTFPGHVSTDKALRDRCTAADIRISAYQAEACSRKDVYDALLAFSLTDEAKALEGEWQRCLAHKLRDFRRLGLHLDSDTAEKVREIDMHINDLRIKFSRNLGYENTSFVFTAAELDGCPESYLEDRRQADGTFKVSLRSPCYIPLMERCKVVETRRKMEKAFNSRCMEENTSILGKLIKLRHMKALLMGYDTHADFITETRMSASSTKVKTFLADLALKLKPLLDNDIKALCKLKEADGYPADCRIDAWDRAFYCKRLEETKHQVDHEELKKYFPLTIVTEGLLEIYQELLGLKFQPDTDMAEAAWHEDVKAFRVTDTVTDALVGYFYMDMHPREGKYGHTACFGLQPACKFLGEWQVPVSAAVCNFPKPTVEKPALLSHHDVETFFHEFGHVMHQLCSEAQLAMFSGTSVERDFVEAPSQMLENWVWEPKALHRMSKHHSTGEAIPEQLLQALLQSRNANAGLLNMRQVCLAAFDQAIHTVASADTACELARLTGELMTIPTSPGTNMAATFGHLAGGYDAQYYGYIWSEVYSADMFVSRFEKEGIFTASPGLSYRREVLAKGGSRDAIESLRAFLGRDPIQEPFLKMKGISIWCPSTADADDAIFV